MKIHKLYLENFESHEKTTIEFNPYFNCIVGPTNVGKTAIFNAILFALFNEWDPGFIRRGTNFCKVIVYTDQFTLERVKGDNVNMVIIVKDGQTFKFDNFGKTYPEEVTKLIMLPQQIEDCAMFIGPQDSNAFLIYDPSSVRGSYVGKVTGIDLLNDVVKAVNAEIKKCNDEIADLERKRFSIGEDLKRLKVIDRLESLVDKVEKLETMLSDLTEKNRMLAFYKDKILDLDRKIDQVKQFLNYLNTIDLDLYYEECTEYLECLPLVTNLKKIENDILLRRQELYNVVSNINSKVTDLTSLLRETGRCPLCGSILDSQSVDFIFKDILEVSGW